jgi:TPR repeat protein
MGVPEGEKVLRLQQLIRERETGRHTTHAQCQLVGKYDRGVGVEQDLVEAARLFKLAAEGGFAMAQFNLGTCYSDGDEVEQDYAEAVRWFRVAAAQAYASAQHNLGRMYDTDRGVDQDYVTKTTSRPGDGSLSLQIKETASRKPTSG